MDDDGVIVLVVDDERDHADGMAEALEKVAARAIAVYSGTDALEILRNQKIDVVVTDLKLNDEIDGLKLLQEAKKHGGDRQVILVTAYATIDTCKEAIKRGAYDYLVKPIDIDQLRTVVERAARTTSRTSRPRRSLRPSDAEFLFEGVRGTNPDVLGTFEVLRRVAPTNISVLIEGPSGTGKELLARAIHDNSNRRDKHFRPLNCAGLSETLLESELFGHVKGAFTGATSDRQGLFQVTDKGTLFLDEIGDMPMNMQAKLLRVIEDGVVMPVGSHKPVVVDVRLISATNHDLAELIERYRFRQDLYFRIKGVGITLPPLRARTEDIPALVDYFLTEAVAETGYQVSGITNAAMAVLMSYDWPGNIRQLRNCIRTMLVMCDRKQLDVPGIPPEIYQVRQLTGVTPDKGRTPLAGISLDELEKQAIVDTLAKTKGNREHAAKILGIGERTLYRKIKEYNL